jgi:hypothetical protein
MEVETMQREQRQELFESIRHFSKYKAIGKLDDALRVPDITEEINNSIIKLFEEHFGKED